MSVSAVDRAISHRERLTILTCGLRLAAVVSTLAELEVAELLAPGPLPVGEIAGRCDADPDALYRVLRMAAAFGVFVETEPGVFAGTPLSDPLRAGVAYSLRPLVDYSAKPFVAGPYSRLLHSVRTGQPATDFWAHLRQHPEDEAFFDRMMTELGQWETERHLDVIRPERFGVVADIGGGHGHFLSAALLRAPAARGILVDRPEVLGGQAAPLGQAGVDDRVELWPADFFVDPLPADADAYILKAVLHNWPHEHAVALLRRVRAAMAGRQASLFVVEQVVSPGNDFDHGKVLDIDMLVLFGGKERTIGQWDELFAETGLRRVNDPGAGRWTVLQVEAL